MSSPTVPGVIAPTQLNAITQALAGLDQQQLTWVSGYAAGLAAAGATVSSSPVASAEVPANNAVFTILYGSQTGNAKGVANALGEAASAQGITANVVSMSDYKARQLKSETHVAVVVSTHGEGDPPDDAVELHDFIKGKKAPKLANTKYAVLGLGDTSYEFFCQTAKDFDSKFAELGGTEVTPRVDCDVDYETETKQWIDTVVAKIKADFTQSEQVATAAISTAAVATAPSVYNKQNPFTATLLESIKITGRDSVKDIRHIEISLEDSEIGRAHV